MRFKTAMDRARDYAPAKKRLIIFAILPFFLIGIIFTLAELGSTPGTNGPTAAPNTLDYGLVGYWDFEEGSGQTVKDKSGNGNDGTLGSSSSADSADPVFGPGHDSSGEGGAGLQFDGRDDYANLGHGSNLTSNSGFTYSFWMKWSGANRGGYGGLVEYLNRGIQNSRILMVDSSSKIIVQDPAGTPLTSKYTFSKDAFYHIVLTWDGTLPYLYVNGNLDATGSAASFTSAVSNDIKIGVGADWSPTYYFNGSIDEVRIYNRALSEDEIRQLYNQKKPILEMNFDEGSGNLTGDDSFNDNYAILGGGTAAAMPAWTTGHSGSALDFDGTDDYVEVKGTPSSWDLSLASYDYKSFSVTSQHSIPSGFFFKPDGTKLYIAGLGARIYQYSLSTAWDASTVLSDGEYFSTSSQEAYPRNIFFKPDGTKMFVAGSNGDAVYQYSLSTAWDISTVSYDDVSFSVAGQEMSSSGLFFKGDGSRMYTIGPDNDTVYQYSLAVAWDLSTASYDSVFFSARTQESNPYSVYFRPDGTKMYVIGTSNDAVFQYSLSTAWNVSTASYDSKTFSIAGQEDVPYCLFFKPDGTKMYAIGATNDSVYQYGFYDEDSLDVTGAITLSGWVRINDLSQRMALFGKGVCQTGSGNYGYFLSYYNDNSNIYWDTYSTTTRDILHYEINDTDWHFLTATWDGTTSANGKKLYMDGVLVNQKTSTISAIGDTDYDFRVGIDAEDRFPADGAIDSVRLYNYARTADEILTDYNDGIAAHLGESGQDLDYGLVGYWDMEEGNGQFVQDKSGNGNDGVLGASSSVDSADPVFGPGHDSSGENGTGMVFDGRNDYINAGTIWPSENKSNFSAFFWVKFDALSTYQGLVSKGNSWLPYDGYQFYLGSNKYLYISYKGTTGSCNGIIYNFTYAQAEKWYHLGVTFDSNDKIILYIDGRAVSSTSITEGPMEAESQDLLIGKMNIGSGYFLDGSIDEVRVYNRALSEDEIRLLYNQKKPILHLKMDEGSGANLRDESFNDYDAKIYNKINTAVSFTSNTLYDNNVGWIADEWAGHEVSIVYGTGVGQTRIVASNTSNTLTISSNWDILPDGTSRYAITLDGSSVWTERDGQSALNLNDVGYVGFAPDSGPVSGTGGFTLETWVKTANSNMEIMAQRAPDDIGGEYEFQISITGELYAYAYVGTPYQFQFYSNSKVNDNNWHHVILKRDDNAAYFYIDGVLDNFVEIAASASIDSTIDFAIGCDFRDANKYFNGSLDDVRVYNYARTADEILVDYNEGKAAKLGEGNQDLNYGLVGYWDMEGGNGQTVYDKSGNGNDCTLGSSSSIDSADPVFGSGHDSSGENGTGMVFDGVNDYLDCGNDSSLDTTQAITASVWFYKENITPAYSSLVGEYYSDSNGSYELYLSGSNQVIWATALIPGTRIKTVGFKSFLNGWHNATSTFSLTEQKQKIYVDGVKIIEEARTVPLTLSTRPLKIGGGPNSTGYFNGSIDEVRIYNRALSEDEIRQLYNQKKPILELKMDEGSGGTAYDESFNDNDGTLGGGTADYTPVWVDGKFGSALEFDGVDDYVDAGIGSSLDITKEVTLEGWFNSDDTWNTHVLFGKNRAYYIALVYPNTLRAYLYTADYNLRYSGSVQGLYTTDNWYHVALSYKPDFGYIKLYLNGREVEYETAQSKTDTINITTNHFMLGSNFLSSASYDGTLDDIRVYNYARTDAEILTDYNAGMAAHLR